MITYPSERIDFMTIYRAGTAIAINTGPEVRIVLVLALDTFMYSDGHIESNSSCTQAILWSLSSGYGRILE